VENAGVVLAVAVAVVDTRAAIIADRINHDPH
jgi:hypothetical protein